jgi:hypothetical protein
MAGATQTETEEAGRWSFQIASTGQQFVVELRLGAVSEEMRIPNGLLHSYLASEPFPPEEEDREAIRKLLAALLLDRYVKAGGSEGESAAVPVLPSFEATVEGDVAGEPAYDGATCKIWRIRDGH